MGGFARGERREMGTKTAAISGLDGQGIKEGGVLIEERKANRSDTEMSYGRKMTASKIHNKPVEKTLAISSLLGCLAMFHCSGRSEIGDRR